LKESATALLNKVKPKPTDADRRAALRTAVAHAHQFGVTSVQNAGTSFEDVALYQQALRAGRSCRCGRTWPCRPRPARPRPTSTAWMRLARPWATDPTLTTGRVKIYADGVIESRTGGDARAL
jgi:predicted amidohydrolase YtcJ